MARTTFGINMKAHRKAMGMTLQQLADKIHSNKQTLSKYELGARTPRVSMAQKIADALNTTVPELTKEGGERFVLTREERTLIESYRGLTREARSAVLMTIRAFAANPAMNQDDTIGGASAS
ncbi:MAG: helix-turn-helix transcriptional regulator [Lachnospiraceae bacterium]|nr:helix-turn-helix transcriptional regulator [Lachnospiraceae bacterium]